MQLMIFKVIFAAQDTHRAGIQHKELRTVRPRVFLQRLQQLVDKS